MQKNPDYQHVDRSNLAVYLAQQQITGAETLGGAHIYRCQTGKHQSLVVSLPDGSGLIIRCEQHATVDRRRLSR